MKQSTVELLDAFRMEENDIFDEDGEAWPGSRVSNRQLKLMHDLINALADEVPPEVEEERTRKTPQPEIVFYRHITSLVKNLLIDNKNYSNNYFWEQSKHDLLTETKERANYILEEIAKTKHLIGIEEEACHGK